MGSNLNHVHGKAAHYPDWLNSEDQYPDDLQGARDNTHLYLKREIRKILVGEKY